MPADQPVELLVGRRREGTLAFPARYLGNYARGRDVPPRRLREEERAAIARASALLTDAILGIPVDETEVQSGVELLHRLSLETQGEPRFQLPDGRLVAGTDLAYRATLE